MELPLPIQPAPESPPTHPVGHQLRQRRLDLGLTLKDVAEGAGLSVGFISQLERGITAPSLSSLQQPRAGQSLSRHGQRQLYSLADLSEQAPANPIRYERVSTNFPGRKMHSVIMNVPPGYRSETIAHDGEEMIYVLSGELTSFVDGHHTILQPGDAEHFPSTLPHSVWNHTGSAAQLLWVGTQELFGQEPLAEAGDDTEKPPA
jgi:quercetin dioxygenase-like cupin family protein